MFIMFADRQGMLLSHAVPQRVTVNSQYYSKVLRRDLPQTIQKKRPGKAISDFLLHQDNAPPHVSAETRLELSLLELETVPHAPYSPDLAPMDFAIFPEIKSQLRGKRFGDFAELRQAVSSIISNYDRPGTEIYFEDGLIATRSVLENMDSILKNYEVLCAHKVTCHKDFDNTTSN